MNPFYLWIAQATPEDLPLVGRKWSDPARRDLMLVLVAVGILLLGLAVYALFLRKSTRHRRHRQHHRHHPDEETSERGGLSLDAEAEDDDGHGEDDPDEDRESGRRRRRRRREHRPRNPTLAETGGLPPVRNQPPRDDSQS